ncbi:MAG: hypothetical protein QGH60_12220 [Phycisphaerae bacterium]|jgi:hypothetical protein|nr:hypothetical protein [Phycisphaerae bacterium]
MTTREINPGSEDSSVSHAEVLETAHSARKWVYVLAVFVAASWVLIAIVLFQHRNPATANGSANTSTDTRPMTATAGPWGELELTPIVIAPPLEYVAESDLDFSGKVVWHVPNVGSVGLTALFKRIGLATPLIAELQSMAKANTSLPGMSIYPSKEFVRGLNAEVRAKLYLALSEFGQNLDLRNQFLFCGDSPDQWFAGSAVSPETRKLVEPFIYKRGNFLYFADMRSIADSIPSREQYVALLKTLRRDATFLVHVKVSEKSDIETLVNYWGRGGRAQEVRPILESLMRRGGDQGINITHLLPPLARRRLYTYPARSIIDVKVQRDCHWTSLNFFNDVPDDKYAAPNVMIPELKENYYRVHANFQLGDLALVVDSRGRSVHSATYIADDILFHRCGADSSAPWTLVKGEDLASLYPRRNKVMVLYYRRKKM